MRKKDFLIKSIIAGTIAGLFLGFLFKYVEVTFNIRVYTLLLNIDFIPILGKYNYPETVEFLLHLLIAVGLSAFMVYIIYFKKLIKRHQLIVVVLVSVLIALVYFPTTVLSNRTPDFTSIEALVVWIVGHLLFGIVLASLYFILFKNKKV
ncbi:hypothetical protein ACQKM9_09960 [Viridibacillus sp. NPDC093762]|uniref:hypothetical protein n=1 Tax=Viridibacillus sp. NPDC093762 TaxID=3390720 RepID=UPI003D0315C9